uniref:NADH-ubiquinone oxidoreductase chain 5 n=1 Tax=Jakoba libera TaxID=143017 RepID=M4QLB3_JAKLI|nr:NADH dehydrogenase subunit 5 [Jakoba libera]AGH24233.1 NADH dehydrogenase subunit 5 [Jakoba libera]
MYLTLLFLPILSSLTVLSFGRSIGKWGSCILSVASVVLCSIFSWICFYEVGLCGSVCRVELFPWFHSELVETNWGFLFDSLTVTMLIVVSTISSIVHIYSVGYMSHDPHLPRFMSYLSLFTFFMLILVTGDNFLQLFLGWEGVGLCSYLLINFWYTRLQANKSAIKAMIMNRLGDFGLSLGLLGIFYLFRSLDYDTVFSCAQEMSEEYFGFLGIQMHALTVICILLFVGAVGKSSQLGLHTWLPDAMEGPTPVSALIHAATMVTAGIFLVVRCSPLFEYSSTALVVITIVGSATAFFAATTGMVQNDIKRVIAYSTCSQLGYMAFACGLSGYSIGMFHLMNHAFFKALLFLGAGCVIHALADEQDMRKMGGLVRYLPFTYGMMLLGSLSLMGFPFLTGFYSKDVILELAYAKFSMEGTFAHWLGTSSAFLTAFYSFRLLYYTFLSNPNGSKSIYLHAHDAPAIMSIPLLVLAFGSIFVGYLAKDLMIGLGTDFWAGSIFVLPEHIIQLQAEFIPSWIKMTPVFFSLLGASSAMLLYSIGSSFSSTFFLTNQVVRSIYLFLAKRWFFDIVYNELIAKKLLRVGYHTTLVSLDKGVIELIGPHGLEKAVVQISQGISKLQSGYIYHYAFVMLIGITLLVSISAFWNWIMIFDWRISLIITLTTLCLFFTWDYKKEGQIESKTSLTN